MFQEFKTEIKILIAAVIVVIIFVVGGVFLLRSTPTSPSQDISMGFQFTVGEEVIVRGKVIENVTACVVDGACYLRVEVEGNKIVIPYGYGRNIDGRYCIEGSVQEAFGVKKGSEVEVLGVVTGEAEISPCDSSSYYIRLIGDDASIDISTDSTSRTASWQTYRNEEFGGEIKAPPSVKVEASDSGFIFFIKVNLPQEENKLTTIGQIQITKRKATQEIIQDIVDIRVLEIGERLQETNQVKVKNVNLDGCSGSQIRDIDSSTFITGCMRNIEDNDYIQAILFIEPTYSEEYSNLYNQILSTFRFVEPIFVRQEGWGPCPPEGVCTQLIMLYDSGKLVASGSENYERQLEQARMNQIISYMREFDLLHRECVDSIVLDYSAAYTLNLDDEKREIRFPACEDELKRLEDLIGI